MSTFKTEVLMPVKRYLGPSASGIRLPSAGAWSFRKDDDRQVVQVDLQAASLRENLQTDSAAVPSFALCFAYWMERLSGVPTHCEVRVDGEGPSERSECGHWNRSQILLQEYVNLFGDKFHVPRRETWTWPRDPILNEPQGERSNETDHDPFSEHGLEVQLCKSANLAATFSAELEANGPFERQLPVGLFHGRVSEETQLTPAKGSQIDLWSVSPDGKTFHLFELKKLDNKKVGIIPEAFYYARLLQYVRVGLPNGGRI